MTALENLTKYNIITTCEETGKIFIKPIEETIEILELLRNGFHSDLGIKRLKPVSLLSQGSFLVQKVCERVFGT